MVMNQEKLEQKLMDMFLSGNEPILETLRTQYKNSTINSREFTGVGFYTHYLVNPKTAISTNKKSFELTDITATISKMEDALGFVLFVRDGYISWLEGYTIALDFWPTDYSDVNLIYNYPEGKRDLNILQKRWL
jgi:hypothetical protein